MPVALYHYSMDLDQLWFCVDVVDGVSQYKRILFEEDVKRLIMLEVERQLAGPQTGDPFTLPAKPKDPVDKRSASEIFDAIPMEEGND